MKNNFLIKLILLISFLMPVLLFSQVIVVNQQKSLTAPEKSKAIGKISKLLKEKYVFPDKAKEMAEFINARLKNNAYDTVNDAMQFANVLTADLQSITHDKHLRIRFSPEDSKRLKENENNQGTPEGEKMFLEQMKRENYGFKKVEILSGNIGYIDFRNFAPADYSKETVASAMKFVSACDALIFDMRQNGGGAPDCVRLVCSYLFGKNPVHINDIYQREGDNTEEFWTLKNVDGKKMPDVPVYVLTSHFTFSGAEEFAYDLKNQKRATIVGDVTGGGANPGGTVSIDNNFIAFIPTGRAISPVTNTNWEGTGVQPDVQIESGKALEKAQILALGKISENIKNEADKNRFKWMAESLESVLNAHNVDENTLKSYAGDYGDRLVTFEGGKLYYQRKGRPIYQMTAMSDDTFMFKDIEYFRIRFNKDLSGNVIELVGMYDDGHNDRSARVN